MDFKEFLIFISTIFDNSKIKEIAESLKDNDTAISDEVSGQLKDAITENMGSFMSMEAAQNNPKLEKYFYTKVYPKIQGDLLGNIDNEIEGIAASVFGADIVKEIIDQENTKEKLKIFKEKSKEILKKKFSGDEAQQKLQEAHDKINHLQEEYANKLQAKEQEIEQEKAKVHDVFIKSKFVDMAKSYQWQESLASENVQSILIDRLYSVVKNKASLKVNDIGGIDVYQKDDPETLLFENNKKLEIKDLLDKEIDPYLDKAPAKKKPILTQNHLNKGQGDLPKMRQAINQGVAEFQNKIVK